MTLLEKLEVIRDALCREEIVVGEFGGQDEETVSFIPWQSSAADALQRIDPEAAASVRRSVRGLATTMGPDVSRRSRRRRPSQID